MSLEVVHLNGTSYIVSGKRIYGSCERCWKLVWINKPIIRDLHVCEPKDEI